MANELSDYERLRLENIQRNQALLRQLEIPHIIKQEKRSRSSSPSVIKHAPKKKPAVKAQPTRVSARLRGISADVALSPGHDTEVLDNREAKKPKRIDRLDDAEQQAFMSMMKNIMPNTQPEARPVKQEQVAGLEAVRQETSQLQIRHPWATVKVTPERISCGVFHPWSGKLLACAGDVTGHLGFWDVQGQKEADNQEEDQDPEPVVYTYRPHTRSITELMFNPTDPNKLFTSSYDGTIQYFDMEKATFDTLSMGDESYPFTNFDITQDGRTVWFSTSDGEVGSKDIRSRHAPTVHVLREKKIGCVNINPVQSHLLAVASNDRTATIWDIRKLKEPLHEFSHGYSVTSAYWSPLGNKLATTSYDDYIRLFELDAAGDMKLQSAIAHNTHTGKWVTNLRARWNDNTVSPTANGKNHQHFVVGNMKHPVDIFSGETGGIITKLYDADHITAVPAVARFHPTTTTTTILCGNGSGRMVCWS